MPAADTPKLFRLTNRNTCRKGPDMNYVYGYFVVCIAFVAWLVYSAEHGPVAEVGVDA